MSIQAIVFDLDNTIYPASSGLIRLVEHRIHEFVMQTLGVDEPTARAMCNHYYATYGTTLRGLQTQHGYTEAEAYVDFVHNVAVETCLVPNARLIELLDALPIRKVIFTNSVAEWAERVLQCLNIREHFDVIYDVRYFQFRGKPDPAAYEHILAQLGLRGEDVVMVEDSLLNLPPAKALGMTTILIDETGMNTGGADYVVRDAVQGLEIVHGLVSETAAEDGRTPLLHAPGGVTGG